MFPLVNSRPRALSRGAVLALIAAGAASCSADVSRFAENPFASKPEITGAVPSGRVESQQLPPPPAPARISSTGATAAPNGTAWSRPASVTTQPQPTRVADNVARPPAGTPKSPMPGGVHVVAPGETLMSLGRLYGKSRADIANANNISVETKLNVGQRVTIPGVAQIKTDAKQPIQAAAKAPAPATKLQAPALKIAKNEPSATAHALTPAKEAAKEAPAPVVAEKETEATGAAPTFRWPVRGRIISNFGGKTGGQNNDGINLAVPEGTSVKASEDGVVAYAGNELKGYGNLVLIRHSGGYVTAYAHASEVMVKRGDKVKRGQIIARAGQTGSVTGPQLHFEIRKGSNPVDPMQFLNGARADL